MVVDHENDGMAIMAMSGVDGDGGGDEVRLSMVATMAVLHYLSLLILLSSFYGCSTLVIHL